jgi:hypothetical protein
LTQSKTSGLKVQSKFAIRSISGYEAFDQTATEQFNGRKGETEILLVSQKRWLMKPLSE